MIEHKIVQLRDQIEKLLNEQSNEPNDARKAASMDIDAPDVLSILSELENELGRLGSHTSTLREDDLLKQNKLLKEVLIFLFRDHVSDSQQIDESSRVLDTKIKASYALRRIIETVHSV